MIHRKIMVKGINTALNIMLFRNILFGYQVNKVHIKFIGYR